MATNSAVIMPLNRCCLEKIQKTKPEIEGDIMWCRSCGTYLVFRNNAWKKYFDQEWYEFINTQDD